MDSKSRDRQAGYPFSPVVACIVFIAAAGIVFVVGVLAGWFLKSFAEQIKKPSINASVIQQKISMCSELTTAKQDYQGTVYFKEGDITWINEKSFAMGYEAHIEAGIDLSKAVVTVDGTEIHVKLPDPEIQVVKIDSNSLTFSDETFSLFNWIQHDDVAEAIQYAEEDAYSYVEDSSLLLQADQQAEEVITTLLQPILEDEENTYELIIE